MEIYLDKYKQIVQYMLVVFEGFQPVIENVRFYEKLLFDKRITNILIISVYIWMEIIFDELRQNTNWSF